MFNELDTVVLTHDVKEHNLTKGDVGTVTLVHEDKDAFEVEFVTAEGKTVALLTLTTKDLRSIERSEILHVRGYSTV